MQRSHRIKSAVGVAGSSPTHVRIRVHHAAFRSTAWGLGCLIAAMLAAARPLASQSRPSPPVVTLQELLDSVAARHPLVQAAQARVRATRGARVTAGAFGNPMLSYEVENAPLPGRASPPMGREAMVMATFPLEQFYQRGPRVRRADSELRAAEADANVERQRILLGAARAFYSAALAQEELDAARDLGGWLDTIVAYNAIRVAEGVAAEADLLRSRLERDRASADAALREAELIRARADVGAFLGDASPASTLLVIAADARPLAMPTAQFLVAAGAPLPPPSDTGPRIAGVFASGPPSPLISAALTGRGETRAARERLAAAGAGIASERRMLVRDLGMTVGTKQSEGSTSLLAGVSLPFPLFNQNRGEIVRATAERDAAAFELAAEERAVSAEVIGAYEAARVLTDRVTTLASSGPTGYLARADEARRIALGAYQEGAIPLIQVIDAARAWGEARVTFHRTLFTQHESVLMLLAARGIDLATAPLPRGNTPQDPTR